MRSIWGVKQGERNSVQRGPGIKATKCSCIISKTFYLHCSVWVSFQSQAPKSKWDSDHLAAVYQSGLHANA